MTVTDATAIDVRLDDDPEWRRDAAPVVVFGIVGWNGLLPGQRVIVRGRLQPARPGDTVSALVFASAPPRKVGSPPVWQRVAGHVRDRLRTSVDGLPGDERGLVPGLVIGDVSAMPPDLTGAFRITGLTHLNAVSGANVAIVLGAVLASVRRLGARRRLRSVLAGAALLGFVVLVRPSPSVLRAAVMGGVVLIGSAIGRRSATVPVLSAAVLLLVVTDPFLARTPGFALSVLATAAIVVFGRPLTDCLAEVMPRPLAGAVAVPTVAQLACTPILVAVFGQVSPWAVPANLLAAPAVAPATLLGIGCALTGVVWQPAASLLARLAAVPAWWLATVARTLSAAPGAGLDWPDGVRGLALLGIVSLAVVLGWRRLRRARRRAMLDVCPR
jgi:competence protein ComEC